LERYRRFETVLEIAKSRAGDLQPWPGYYDTKARELETILSFYDSGRVGSILEIGCGNGFTSCLLSGMSERVEAIDLPSKDPKSHSLGVGCAVDLIGRVDIANVNVTSASAVEIPFGDKEFDIVFSEYVIQYISDKNKALGEVRRVLSDTGVVIAIVPNFMERLLVPFVKYEYAIKRLFSGFGSGQGACCNGGQKDGDVSGAPGDNTGRLLRAANDYLFLKPDGAYKSYMEEILRHLPGSWKRLFYDNGFKVAGTFTTQLVPLGLFELMGAPSVRMIAKKSHYLNMALGGVPVIKHLGYSFGIIAKKR